MMGGMSLSIKALTPSELTRKVIHKEKLFILDVRNKADFDDWKIEGEGIKIINIPYFDLLDGVEDILSKLPKQQEIVVVCAKEGSSVMVAEMLVEAGMPNISYLQGGMRAWSDHLEPVKIGDLKTGGELYQFVRIGKGCLSYYVESNGQAAVIDAVRTIDVFTEFAKLRKAKIVATIDTHLHADHISGGRALAEKTSGKYYLPEKDATEVTFAYNKLEEGNDIKIGNTQIVIQPLYSPGHTIGSTSLIIDDQYLITGDILFIESIGRPDLAGKAEDWVSDLRHTLYDRYQQLPKKLLVLPAHFGFISELGDRGEAAGRLRDLFANNAGLNIDDEREFRKTVTENLPPQPNSYQEIRQTNMGKITPTAEEQREMEIGPNRCAVHG